MRYSQYVAAATLNDGFSQKGRAEADIESATKKGEGEEN